MPKTLAPQYLKEARRIRSTYVELNERFDELLDGLSEYKEDIAKIERQLAELDVAQLADDIKMSGLTRTMVDLQKAHDRMAAVSKPHQDAMEQLNKDAKTLHDVLKERYPEMSDQELAQALEIGYSN